MVGCKQEYNNQSVPNLCRGALWKRGGCKTNMIVDSTPRGGLCMVGGA
jgi:hypothetical protein